MLDCSHMAYYDTKCFLYAWCFCKAWMSDTLSHGNFSKPCACIMINDLMVGRQSTTVGPFNWRHTVIASIRKKSFILIFLDYKISLYRMMMIDESISAVWGLTVSYWSHTYSRTICINYSVLDRHAQVLQSDAWERGMPTEFNTFSSQRQECFLTLFSRGKKSYTSIQLKA